MLEIKSAQIRLDTLMASQKANCGCTGACMSVVEVLVALYYGKLNGKSVVNFDALKPGADFQDYVILSKTSASLVQYAILADLGFFDKSELNYFGSVGSLLPAYPLSKVPGIPVSVLGDGYGLSIALGLALSLKTERKPNKVFVVVGSEELGSGQIWEAANIAAHYKLDNLIVFVDEAYCSTSSTILSTPKIGNIQDKFEAFGWKVMQIADGHNFDEILDVTYKGLETLRTPVCIWAHTIAGKGIAFAERKQGYLNTILSENELLEVIPKLKAIV